MKPVDSSGSEGLVDLVDAVAGSRGVENMKETRGENFGGGDGWTNVDGWMDDGVDKEELR